jgi:hypothetical protein
VRNTFLLYNGQLQHDVVLLFRETHFAETGHFVEKQNGSLVSQNSKTHFVRLFTKLFSQKPYFGEENNH